ncbi:Qat anti-phage system QueC-like protein QatC [Brevundimonas sp.]|uniref:Qat anti-phage system QueC-like protein QatC n=1 Tax=Brevundimonas sp. TaxID=1871086 RepID=UPI003F728976
MVTTLVTATPDAARALAAQAAGRLAIALFQVGRETMPGVGHGLPHSARALPHPPTTRAWDFLSIALAVFGADRFVLRSDAADGWTRMIEMEVELVEPDPWTAIAPRLAAALRFLTGDIWILSFRAGGAAPPTFQPRLSDRDSVCLFSGGLDSLIGAMGLLAEGRRPLLVSQASPVEGPVQAYLADRLGLADHRFVGRATERGMETYEQSSRGRSILFFAYGALAAEGLGGVLTVPENGLISINPPLTNRRIGSLSTRTTHPHFISELQSIFAAVGLNVRLHNPYGLRTKGEMLAECDDPRLPQLASLSYSCGKGKRLNRQCGRCVPCLIRRASFAKAGVPDATDYHVPLLADAARNDDVQAARWAVEQLKTRDLSRWAGAAGPLPRDTAERAQYVDVVRRGLGELRDLFAPISWP